MVQSKGKEFLKPFGGVSLPFSHGTSPVKKVRLEDMIKIVKLLSSIRE
jgi:hypothetical protein